MYRFNRKNKSTGQTVLEYTLVVGVIAVGVIFAGRKIFGEPGSKAEQLMEKAVQHAQKTIGDS